MTHELLRLQLRIQNFASVWGIGREEDDQRNQTAEVQT